MVVRIHILSPDSGVDLEDQIADYYGDVLRMFNNENVSWYFNDWNKRFHPDGIRGNINLVVDSRTLMLVGETIMRDIGVELDIVLDDDPIEAKKQLDYFKHDDLSRLQIVINELDKFLEQRDSAGAWEFLKGGPKKFTHSIPNIISDVYDYVELAIFFYVIGMTGLSIRWEV